MNQYDQNRPQESERQPYSAPGPFVAPPPAGYPTEIKPPQNEARVETKSRGEGFWKGCCAGLCCCCMLETCF